METKSIYAPELGQRYGGDIVFEEPKRIYSDLELQVFDLRYRQEWLESCIKRLVQGKPVYTFNEWLELNYKNPDEFDDNVLTQLFDAQYLDMIPFGTWDENGNRVSDDYYDD